MKLLPWIINKPIEAYTTLAYDGDRILDMSYNGSLDDHIILQNRKKLAKELNTDLEHMVATSFIL